MMKNFIPTLHHVSEWRTLLLVMTIWGAWSYSVFIIPVDMIWISVVVLPFTLTLYQSCQHEAIHHHPFTQSYYNDMIVMMPLTLLVPYYYFKESHLKHHQSDITDPDDDPESFYVTQEVWNDLSIWQQKILIFNNCILGRLILGRLIYIYRLPSLIKASNHKIVWLSHVIIVAVLLILIHVYSHINIWLYCLCAFIAESIIAIRSFLEHQCHDDRTVIIDDNGLLAFLFLNNNYHDIHHKNPAVAWYKLPRIFDNDRNIYERGYFYKNYKEIFKKHFLLVKEPIIHPKRS